MPQVQQRELGFVLKIRAQDGIKNSNSNSARLSKSIAIPIAAFTTDGVARCH
jgi:hypothetical protein